MSATSCRKDMREAIGEIRASEALSRGQRSLGKGPESFREAELLLSDLMGVDRVSLHRDDARLDEATWAEYASRLARRLAGEPVQYITGSVDFLSFRLSVGPGVLVPRPETELWLAELIDRWPSVSGRRPERVVDLCAGSGCIALGLSRAFPRAQILAMDRSEAALAYARRNVCQAGARNVSFLCSDLVSALRPGRMLADLLVCNPPYISRSDYGELSPTVRDWEPGEALLGGEDGLQYYREIARNLRPVLRVGAVVALEVGSGQGRAVSEILEKAGVTGMSVFRDLGGHDRAVFGVLT